VTFHILGTILPNKNYKCYSPPSPTSRTRNSPSQFDENLLSDFLASLHILQTRSPLCNLLGRTFVLYLLDARSLHAASQILLSSRSSLMRSSPTARLSWLSCRLVDGSPTSTGIVASVPYVRLYAFLVLWFEGYISMPTGLRAAPRSTFLSPCRVSSSIRLREPCWSPLLDHLSEGARRAGN